MTFRRRACTLCPTAETVKPGGCPEAARASGWEDGKVGSTAKLAEPRRRRARLVCFGARRRREGCASATALVTARERRTSPDGPNRQATTMKTIRRDGHGAPGAPAPPRGGAG